MRGVNYFSRVKVTSTTEAREACTVEMAELLLLHTSPAGPESIVKAASKIPMPEERRKNRDVPGATLKYPMI
jgi:hypothetical protein